MASRTRRSDAGYVYHLLNRAVWRAKIFAKSSHYAAFATSGGKKRPPSFAVCNPLSGPRAERGWKSRKKVNLKKTAGMEK